MKWTADEFTGRRLGKYEVLCRLAIGGMAEIFLGFAHAGRFVGRPVVIKRILNERREDANALQMLLDEAKMTATLSHPNVAQVMDLETDDDEVMLVIEFINGANLEEIVENYTSRQEAVPLGFAITVIREAAQGLAHAHSHKNARGALVPIIHRDVTPRNIMVDYDGATKVLDFGIARAKGSERRTQAGMVRGTTAYMSPEQAIGKELDPRTDLFSLGTIFHELLTGQRLFYKGNPGQEMAAVYEGEIPLPSRVNRRVPKHLDTLVMRLLERKLDKRYQSALEFIRDLSLAAGSTAWGRDRCAELVRERFAARQRDVEKLVVRIPRPAPAPLATAPAYPEGRTIVSRTPQAGGSPLDHESGARTLVGAQPLGARGPLTLEADRESATDPSRPAIAGPPAPASVAGPRPATPPPQPPTIPTKGLDPAELFEHESGVDTRIIPGGSLRGLPRVNAQSAEARRPPAAAAAPAAPRPSKVPLVLAAIVALLLGGVGGAFLFRSVLAPQPPPAVAATVVRFQLSSDRPVKVFLGKQELGPTPISVFIPSGAHHLELVEPGTAEGVEGPRHVLEVQLPAGEAEAKMAVTLDSLPVLP